MSRNLLLGVNIDHAATVRQARYREQAHDRGRNVEPDPVDVALMAERAGADAITMHLREDRRHIQDSDVFRMREMIHTPLNLEMAATGEMLSIALKVRPDVVLLVPEGRNEVTTEGGLDVAGRETELKGFVDALQREAIAVSCFIDPDPSAVEAASRLGARMVELHTGAFAHAWFEPEACEIEYQRLADAANLAAQHGLLVNAGHGVNFHNIRYVRQLPHLRELNIGHSIISRAVITGISESVATMKQLMTAG